MDTAPTQPSAFSTPDNFSAAVERVAVVQPRQISDSQIDAVYGIDRTVSELRNGARRRVALQFPDDLLPDAPRVYRRLDDLLNGNTDHTRANAISCDSTEHSDVVLFILADTSYSACCVDEIAAEHIDADVVVHYGRACLSPTARLPVVHVFTRQALDLAPLLEAFERVYSDKDDKIILAADLPYTHHLEALREQLQTRGYKNLFQPDTCHDPSSPIPNRTVPREALEDPQILQSWRLFHIAEPPKALLLTLASRVHSIHIYPIDATAGPVNALEISTAIALRRRYALVTRLSRASIIGILVNTLSVHAFQSALEGTKARIEAAGKHSYVFAMGRLNSAKIANFAEVDGWVVLGCWESSLIENVDFEKPVVAPFELDLALQSDEDRIWTGHWRGDFGNMTIDQPRGEKHEFTNINNPSGPAPDLEKEHWRALDSDSESEPPEYDLRTGQYVISSGRRGKTKESSNAGSNVANTWPNSLALTHRARGDLATIGGSFSPGAQYLHNQRTWKGLGSDFQIAYEEEEEKGSNTTSVREGRSGIARGYNNEKSSGTQE